MGRKIIVIAILMNLITLEDGVNAINLKRLEEHEFVEGNTDSEGEAEVAHQSSDDDGTQDQFDGFAKTDENALMTNQDKMEFFTRVDQMSLAQ